MLVDSRGNPLVADAVGPMYGPVRFEDQPRGIRRLGRKQLARHTRSGRLRKKAWWAKNAGRSFDLPSWATKRAEKRRSRKASGTSRRRRRVSARSRRSYSTSAYRTSSRRSRRSVGARRSRRTVTRKELRRQNRAAWRAQMASRRTRKTRGTSSRRKGRKSSYRRKASRRPKRALARRSSARRGTVRRGAARGKRITYGQIMTQLRGSRMKAWVCAGPKRTGCGGGRKGRRGSRVLGVLRG